MKNRFSPFNVSSGVLIASVTVIVVLILVNGSTASKAVAVFSALGLVVVCKCFAKNYWVYALMILAGCLISVAAIQNHQQNRFYQLEPKKDIDVTGTIASIPVKRNESLKFDFDVGKDLGNAFSGKAKISWFDAEGLQVGQRWSLIVRLKEPHGFASQGAFDYEAWLARENIQATGYVRSGTYLGEDLHWRYAFHRIRERLKNWLTTELSDESANVFSALLLGDKSGVSPKIWGLYNNTGTTHLLVISGLHIGLMTWLGFNLASLLALLGVLPLKQIPLLWIKAFSGVSLAMIYALLAGFSIPVQRALVMTVIALLSCCLGMRAAVITMLVFALGTVLLLEPLAFTSVGFWYSFIAVASLCIGLAGRPALASPFQRIVKPQWLVFLVLLPLLLVNGQPVSLLSPLINLLTIPFVGLVIVPLLLLSGGLYFIFPEMASTAVSWLGYLMEYFHIFLEKVGGWSLLVPPMPFVQPEAMVFALVGMLLLIIPAALKLRWLSAFFMFPLVLSREKVPEYGVAEVSVMDVGQGLSVIIRTRHHSMLYDTGDKFSETFSAADSVIIPALSSAGIREIDRVMVSHGDKDHAGGVSALIDRYGEFDLMAGSDLPAFNSQARRCHKGESWQWDGVDFQVLSGGDHRRSNDASCVLKVTAGEKSMLLPGDISQRIEKALIADSDLSLKSDVLLAAHHGSRFSTGAGFLEAVQPEVVIFSSGFANQFNHPASETVNRVQSAGAQSFNTKDDGTVSFTLGDHTLLISAYRKTHSRYWRR